MFYALAAVKGVGRQAMDHVVEVREAGGPFKSIADFARRVDPRLVNKRAFENLVRAGRLRQPEQEPPPAGGEFRPHPGRGAGGGARARKRAGQSLFGGGAAQEELRLTAMADWPAA